MSSNAGIRTVTVAHVALALLLAMIAGPVMAQSIQGTATYRDRMAFPPGSVFEATIEDVSRADMPSNTVATTRVTSTGNPSIAFAITYDKANILPTTGTLFARGSCSTTSFSLRAIRRYR